MARVKAEPGRSVERSIEAIGKWWSEYERRDGDDVIKA